METSRFTFDAIGTHWIIDLKHSLSQSEIESTYGKILSRIDVFDKTYSRFRDDSLISEMAKSAGTYTLPDDGDVMLSLYEKLFHMSKGLFTPLIGQTLVEAGYDKDYSLKSSPTSPVPSWDEVLEFKPPNALTLKKPAILDFGAAGKGYLVDIIGTLLKESGISSYTIDAGGDILHMGEDPLEVGLENPENFEQVIGVVNIENQSICGSAGNRRAWGKYHHIINPMTRTSPQSIKAVWVIAKTAIITDALTTCLYFLEPELFQNEFDFEYLILNDDFSIKKSSNFNAHLFTS